MIEKIKKLAYEIFVDLLSLALAIFTLSLFGINVKMEKSNHATKSDSLQTIIMPTYEFEIGYVDRKNNRIGFFISPASMIDSLGLEKYGEIEQMNYGKPWKKQSEYWLELHVNDCFEIIVTELREFETK